MLSATNPETGSQTPTSLNPYISSTTTTLDPGQTYAAAKKTNQTLDQYGNLTQQQIFDFGNLSTPVRTYTNVFLNDNCGYPNHICGSNYAARYIFNRPYFSDLRSLEWGSPEPF